MRFNKNHFLFRKLRFWGNSLNTFSKKSDLYGTKGYLNLKDLIYVAIGKVNENSVIALVKICILYEI